LVSTLSVKEAKGAPASLGVVGKAAKDHKKGQAQVFANAKVVISQVAGNQTLEDVENVAIPQALRVLRPQRR
jgi:hypothetical protein